MKQALGLRAGDDKEWKPTSNARNNEMVKEAKRFAQQLKKLHKLQQVLFKSREALIFNGQLQLKNEKNYGQLDTLPITLALLYDQVAVDSQQIFVYHYPN